VIALNLYDVAVVGALFLLYTWAFYNMPILVTGAKTLRVRVRKEDERLILIEKLPLVSIIVPVKDEARVIRRLLEASLGLNYPPEKREVIIVDGASVDGTLGICEEYVGKYPGQLRLLHQSVSNGKPCALNYALKHVKGEIVGVFDADNIPEPEASSAPAVGYHYGEIQRGAVGRRRSMRRCSTRVACVICDQAEGAVLGLEAHLVRIAWSISSAMPGLVSLIRALYSKARA